MSNCEDCNNGGYLLVENDVHGVRIERCDACERFKSDAEASEHVFRLANMHNELVEAMAEVVAASDDHTEMGGWNRLDPLLRRQREVLARAKEVEI